MMDATPLTLLDRLRTAPDSADWERLVQIYQPWITRWLARSPLQQADHEDLVQEVLRIVISKLGEFQRRREGSFRAWLRVVTANCLRAHWRSAKVRPQAAGGSDFLKVLQDLEDSHGQLARLWDAEHDRHVVHRALELIAVDLEVTTVEAFRRFVLEGQTPEAIARAMGITRNAVVCAKARVMRRLRAEINGLIE